MTRPRPIARLSSEAPSETSSSTSPERAVDDDTDFFMEQANDSESSIGVANFRDPHVDQSQNVALPPISRLPPELLIAIFSKIEETQDMFNCMQVCRSWAANCVAIMWHRPSCNKWRKLVNVASSVGKTDGLFTYADLIRRLNLSGLVKDVSDGTVVPFTQCKRIERLTLTNCSQISDKGVSDLVEGNRHLQALDVTDLQMLTDHTIYVLARNCPRLQGLNISNCNKITDESLLVLSQSCRHIKRLKLNGVTNVTDTVINSFAQNCPAILEIDLHGCKQITSATVTTLLTTLRHLRELRLAHCTEISSWAFTDLSQNIKLDSLRILDLTACELVGDEAVERIISAAPRLRNLVLAKCRFITNRSLRAISKLGKNLHYVHLGHCSLITDDAVIELIKACNRIRYIDLACCTELTDDTVIHLAALPKLRRIGLVKCAKITNFGIKAFTFKHPHHRLSISNLERVHLSYCTSLTLESIHPLVNKCPRLTHLSLTGVQPFLRPNLTGFCRAAPEEFTEQQRDAFCVFSGEGVTNLRNYLNEQARHQQQQQSIDTVMWDDDEEMEDEEGNITGLMHATGLDDGDYIDVRSLED
ncbi:hypothetical protein N7495_005737 [Penicillium taxi]|uniref:uncharacterized protein n=1 Tax=Penicillium taxi TaxID=168475 RepID=UPI0025450BD5|nr:uncharacterized protein N7495_005737 [Penicillium taxi]KAJ5894046.1 hypothetical protein N7495_005737 [Penicillium taxi]